jgi:tetratricopeptide (TPR) repeat protein
MGGKISQGAGFLNRDEELAILRSLAPPACLESSILIVRAPSGYGKSALMMRLLRWLQINHDINIAVVDPSIRFKLGDARVHNGFFIQRLAEELSGRAAGRYDTLQRYLSEHRWQRAAQKPIADFGRRLPSASSFYEEGLDYLRRFLSRGQYTAENLLKSDALAAVTVCRDYSESVCGHRPVFIVVREAQHIDHQSLRFLLELNRSRQWQYLFMEYTSENWTFEAHHQIINDDFDDRGHALILDLDRLGRAEFERLITRATTRRRAVTKDDYERWSGNIRFVNELKYKRSVSRNSDVDVRLPLSLTEYVSELNKHLLDLSRPQQVMLSLVTVHVEPIEKATLLLIAAAIEKRLPVRNWDEALFALKNTHGFIGHGYGGLHLQDEDIASAVQASVEMRGILGLARHALRDFYVAAIRSRNYALAPMPIAVRQSLSLCATTQDTTLLLNVIEHLSDEIARANDQSIYVDAVIGTIADNESLLNGDLRQLANWAAGIAYETSDFKRTVKVLELCSDLDPYATVMLACSWIEVGKQQEALCLVERERRSSTDRDYRLALDLVELFAQKDLGHNQQASRLHQTILSTDRYKSSALYGYALRFSEAIISFPECTENVLRSVEWFSRFNLLQSRAYSQLAAAIHLARQGHNEQARHLIEVAARGLAGRVRDQHIILNNRAVVGMLSEAPDLGECRDFLLSALRSSRDDFSDVVILNNLAIAYSELHQHTDAVESIDRMLRSLSTPTLDPDLQWGPGFTAMQVFESAGLHERAEIMRKPPTRSAGDDAGYWNYRYGLASIPPPGRYDYLLRFKYHPLFLSHWLIDREGLELLRGGSQR